MSNPSENRKSPWPKYLPYTPIAMGMIQPEWAYMSHFFEEEEEEVPEVQRASYQTTEPIMLEPVLVSKPSEIRINFRSRK